MKPIETACPRLLVALGLAAGLASCGEPPPAEAPELVRPVKVVTLQGGQASGPEVYPGRAAAANQVDLSFRVGGPLIELPAREGQVVPEGGLIARIDPRDFRLAVDATRARFDQAQADFARFAALYEKDAVSKAQLDQARAGRDVAEAALADAEAALRDTSLRAPFTALVGVRFVENFQDVRQKEPIVSLVDVSSIKVVIDVPEGRVARYRGSRGRVTARFDPAPGREFEIEPLEVASQADPRTQTYAVTFIMGQPEGLNILPGMTATVVHEPPAGTLEGLVLPASAVFSDASGDESVWVVDAETDTVERRAVETGSLTGKAGILIRSGLRAGETVAVAGVNELHDGMRVRPIREVRGL